ncbi:MAG: rhodanese-like domain-containing protein [Pseudomonadota bacterium]
MSDQVSSGDVTTIEASDLAAQLTQGTRPNLLLLQVTSAEVFTSAHLPGAQLVTPADLVCGVPPASGRLPERDQLEQLFSRIGYSGDADIVVYDDEGGGWAGRLAWTLDIIGHNSWTYLNGGMHAWAAAGLAFEQGNPPNAPTSVSLSIDTAPIAEIEDVLRCIEDPTQAIWDVRSLEEYLGQRQAAARVGHIPGAVNWDWMHLKDAGNDMRLSEGILAQLTSMEIADKSIITHCQTHHRSGLSYMVGRLLGLNIRAYHGSWSEWGNREDTPIEI